MGRVVGEWFVMFLFIFDYLGKPHCAACNESSLECSPQTSFAYYEELASISIEKYLNTKDFNNRVSKPKNVRVYKIDGVDEDFDISKCLVHCIDILNVTIPKSNINL